MRQMEVMDGWEGVDQNLGNVVRTHDIIKMFNILIL